MDGKDNVDTTYSLLSHTHSVGEIIYGGYDVIKIVGAKTETQRDDVIRNGFDVMYSAYTVRRAVGVYSYVHSVSYHQPSGCEDTETVGVMSDTMVVLSFIPHVRCHIN